MNDLTVFISYRQMHSFETATRLEHAIERQIPRARAFIDHKDIGPGRVWQDVIEQELNESGIVLLLISRAWQDDQWVVQPRQPGKSRQPHKVFLSRPHDEVRKELLLANQRGARIIPVLHNGGEMFTAEQLPSDLSDLSRRQAIRILNENFRVDDPTADFTTLLERLRLEHDDLRLALSRKSSKAGAGTPGPGRRSGAKGWVAWKGWRVRRVPGLFGGDARVLNDLVVEIVQAEGPVNRRRVYRLVGQASGAGKVGSAMRRTIDASIATGVRKGRLVDRAPMKSRPIEERETSMADGPSVSLRSQGQRKFDEIPLTEMAELARLLRPSIGPDDGVIKAVAKHYGVAAVGVNVADTIKGALTLEARLAP